jgi:hypothetical protein
MKLATCTVSYDGYGETGGSKYRLSLLEDSVKKAKIKKVKLICFPGGYLFGSSKQHLEKLAEEVGRLANQNKISIVTGVNLKKAKDKTDDIVTTQSSSFAVCATSKNYDIWYQRSVTSSDKVPYKICSEIRNIKASGKSVEILICGEIFNSRIRDYFIKRKVNAVVDIAHESLRFRIDGTMKIIANNGIACFCSVHADMKGAMKRAYYPKELKKSTRDIDILVEKESAKGPRIEIKFWNI